MQNFNEFSLPESLTSALTQMNFTTPTPIQAEVIPHALQGMDILGSAQTGTGKTAAFAIPVITRLLNNPNQTAVILAPTRELAKQIEDLFFKLVGRKGELKTVLLIGGDPIGKQIQNLKNRPRIIVGTPGRINDHLNQKTLRLNNTGILVLDETDRMLDMGFGVQIDKIVKCIPAERQTMMFSATVPPEIARITGKYLKNPKRIAIGTESKPAENIKQEVVNTNEGNRYNDLLNELNKRTGSVIIFVKTKYGADRLAKRLATLNHSAGAIHGDLRQNKRERVIAGFRSQKYRILVATDIAARGIDIPHIEHVVNYDLPQCPEDYIHRIGRTARAGAKGHAVSFLMPGDGKKWSLIVNMLGKTGNVSNDNMSFERKAESKDYAKKSGNRFFDKKSGGKSFGKKFGGKPFEGKRENRFEGNSEKRSFEGNREGRSFEGNREGRSFEGKREGRSFEGKREGRSFEGKREGRSFEGKREGRSFEGKREGRSFEGNREGRSFEGNSEKRSFGKRSDSRPFKKRSDEGSFEGKREGRSFEGNSNGYNPEKKKFKKFFKFAS